MPNVTLAQLGAHFLKCAAAMPALETKGLQMSGSILARISRSYIGHYQDFGGPFAPWSPLSTATLFGGTSPTGYRYKGKVELGYSPGDNPLLRTGELRDSIEFRVDGRSVTIGSASPVAEFQEFGTRDTPKHNAIPPRPFIGPAVYVHGWDEVQHVARLVFHPLVAGP